MFSLPDFMDFSDSSQKPWSDTQKVWSVFASPLDRVLSVGAVRFLRKASVIAPAPLPQDAVFAMLG